MVTQNERAIEPTLGFGADDFISKSFSASELFSRIQAVLNRQPPAPLPKPDGSHGLRRHQKIEIDDDYHEVFINGEKIELSPMEYRLLALLLENRGRVLSRDKIIDLLHTKNITDRTIDCHVTHLRKKWGHASAIYRLSALLATSFRM